MSFSSSKSSETVNDETETKHINVGPMNNFDKEGGINKETDENDQVIKCAVKQEKASFLPSIVRPLSLQHQND